MLRLVDDHTSKRLRPRPKHIDGWGDLRVLVYQQPHEAIYELLYEYPNMRSYKGWTGLSPPTAYLSTVEHHHIQRSSYTQAPRPCIGKLPKSPRTPTLWIDKHRTWASPRHDEPPSQLGSNCYHIHCMND
jgi:hypothetical protein